MMPPKKRKSSVASDTLESRAERLRNTPKISPDEEFYCRPRRRRLTIEKCLDDYVNANAFANKRSACWRCPQGCANRKAFAGSR
jgi:hypothetical protein